MPPPKAVRQGSLAGEGPQTVALMTSTSCPLAHWKGGHLLRLQGHCIRCDLRLSTHQHVNDNVIELLCIYFIEWIMTLDLSFSSLGTEHPWLNVNASQLKWFDNTKVVMYGHRRKVCTPIFQLKHDSGAFDDHTKNNFKCFIRSLKHLIRLFVYKREFQNKLLILVLFFMRLTENT